MTSEHNIPLTTSPSNITPANSNDTIHDNLPPNDESVRNPYSETPAKSNNIPLMISSHESSSNIASTDSTHSRVHESRQVSLKKKTIKFIPNDPKFVFVLTLKIETLYYFLIQSTWNLVQQKSNL